MTKKYQVWHSPEESPIYIVRTENRANIWERSDCGTSTNKTTLHKAKSPADLQHFDDKKVSYSSTVYIDMLLF